jgi:peptidoglycan/xylan/chitin deacetylase (PgdA/CDA1 family)
MANPVTVKRRLKLVCLGVARAVGLFAVARFLTARRLRILCYHGFGTGSDIEFSPGLFMRLETIRRRFELVRRGGYQVMSLGTAVEALPAGHLPRLPLVITFDDGFYSNLAGSRALMEQFGLPITLYVTTYYVAKKTPIFSHAVRYLFFKTRCTMLTLTDLPAHARLSLPDLLDLADRACAERIMWSLIVDGETHMTEEERVELCRELGRRLGVDYAALAADRRLSMLTSDEIRELSALGVDIQLHTHRHALPAEPEALHREIEENRAVLEAATGSHCDHLCYPSGVYSETQWPTLQKLGIRSATTCEPGLNSTGTPPYRLARFLDFEHLTDLEMDAALSGFLELPRRVKNMMSPRKLAARNDVDHPADKAS